MNYPQALAFGVLQGIAEFLPISSSGHLAAAEQIFSIGIPSHLQAFDILLHAGTLVALLLCYPREWTRILLSPLRRDTEKLRLFGLLVLATVPAAVIGIFFADAIEQHLRSTFALAVGFALTGAVLLFAERFPQQKEMNALGWIQAFLIGCAQSVALVPSISRSGLTIAAGRALKMRREAALDFSFLLAVPVIAGATLVALRSALEQSVVLPSASIVLAGVISSFLSSVLAILLLRRFVARHSLAWFALYLFPVAAFLLAW